MANGIVKYTSKDYESIKSDLIDSISSLTGLWTGREESDPGIVLLKCMAALGDMMSYNFDKQSLEYYAETVTQRKNAYRLFELIGYHMKWYTAAMTTVTLTYNPTMPEYITFLKQAIDAKTEDEKVNAYYNYRNRYEFSTSTPIGIDYASVAIPPVEESPYDGPLTDIEVPKKMIEDSGGQDPRIFIKIDIEGNSEISATSFPLDERIKQLPVFREHAMDFVAYANTVFNYWLEGIDDFNLRTHICDVNKTLDLYSNTSGSIPYSLIPSIDNGKIENGVYKPTLSIKPFTPTQLPAIQGVLKATTFRSSQIRNNKFYIPESDIDETYMWVSYVTYNHNNQAQIPKFLQKTDNLLTVYKVKTDADDVATYSDTTIYFQFKVDDFDYPYIEFSNYWQDVLGNAEVNFTFYYFKTYGKYGNITTNYLKRLTNYSNSEITITNVDTNTATYDINGHQLSYPGTNQETAQDAYVNALNYVMTYDTLVTIFDFERYTKRQSGISNALAVDNQRAQDLNKDLQKEVNSYSLQQLSDILGVTGDIETLRRYLFNARKVVYNYEDAPVSKDDADTEIDVLTPSSTGGFKNYSLHMYPVYGNFDRIMDTNIQIAKIFNMVEKGNEVKSLPYKLYKIYTSDDQDLPSADSIAIEKMLDVAYRDCHIVNVEPSYTALRIFPWRCCGVIHLTKSVSSQDAKQIVRNVIDTIKNTYTANSQKFGEKVSYMELIQVILSSDTRIRYFDAGLGNKKLIEFENVSTDKENYFNVQAYFNKESLMYYAQSAEDNETEGNEYYNWISIDPMYIQKSYESYDI